MEGETVMPTVQFLIEHLQRNYKQSDQLAFRAIDITDVKESKLGKNLSDEQVSTVLDDLQFYWESNITPAIAKSIKKKVPCNV